MAKHNEIGRIGEDIAIKWLKNKSFSILDRNYYKKYGEIDIIAQGSNKSVHFIEVKTVSYETRRKLDHAVTHETWRPEEMVHKHKQDRFKRVIETWLDENNYTGEWQIDVLTLRIVPREKFALLKLLENIIFE